MTRHRLPWLGPLDAGIDPDFEEMGGALTLAQLRNPGLTLAQVWNPKPPTDGDPDSWRQRQLDRITLKRRRWAALLRRLKHTFKVQLSRKRWRLEGLGSRLQAAVSFTAQIARKRERLQLLSKQFLLAQLQGYPKFEFKKWAYNYGTSEKWGFMQGPNEKCNHCVPYNGHHTPNYWATGQQDCW